MPRGIPRQARSAAPASEPAAHTPRADPRPDIRAEPRDDPRARAAQRAAELRLHASNDTDTPDKYAIPSGEIPEGWCYEWKRQSVYGKEDPSYQVAQAQAGWEPVDPKRHPALMPRGYAGHTIERDGMVLMERPQEITDDFNRRLLRESAKQMREQEERVGSAPQGQLQRHDAKGQSLAKVKHEYAPYDGPRQQMAIPE